MWLLIWFINFAFSWKRWVSPPAPHRGTDCLIGGSLYKSINIDLPKEFSHLSAYWSIENWIKLNQLIAGINWSRSHFLGSEAETSWYTACAVLPSVRIMVALYKRASATWPFRCTVFPLSTWNIFCFSETYFHTACVKQNLWSSGQRDEATADFATSWLLLPTSHDNWTLGMNIFTPELKLLSGLAPDEAFFHRSCTSIP